MLERPIFDNTIVREEPKQKRIPSFKEQMKSRLPLKSDPELDFAVSVISRMTQVSDEERWHTLVFSLFVKDPDILLQYGIPERDLNRSIDAVHNSEVLQLMYNIFTKTIDAKSLGRLKKLPHRFEIRSTYHQNILKQYLDQTDQDGKPLTHKQIARTMSMRTGEKFSRNRIDKLTQNLKSRKKVQGRHISQRERDTLKRKVRRLRMQTTPPLTRSQIAKELKVSTNVVKNIVALLARENSIQRRRPPLALEVQQNLYDIFSAFNKKYPGEFINLASVARELRLSYDSVRNCYYRFAKSCEAPPLSGGGTNLGETVIFSALLHHPNPP